MADIVITRHARDRWGERVGLDQQALDAFVGRFGDVRHSRNVPEWAAFTPSSRMRMSGALIGDVWVRHPARAGWERELEVALPIVFQEGRRIAVTVKTRPTDHERAVQWMSDQAD